MDDIRNESLMRSFLLGRAGPEESDRIERELVADPAYFEEMCALEDELAVQYRRGELSAAETEQFERHVLWSPARARHAQQIAAIGDALLERPAPTRRRSMAASWRPWSMAACIAAALVGGWMIWAPSPPPSSPASAVLATFVLTDGQVRSGGGGGNVFRIVSGDGDVELEITVPSASVARPSARLRRVGDAVLPWVGDARITRVNERSSTLTWRVPSAMLMLGDYVLSVSDESTPGTPIPLASAFFRIVP